MRSSFLASINLLTIFRRLFGRRCHERSSRDVRFPLERI